MGKKKLMNIKNKTFCEVLMSLYHQPQNSCELSLSTTKSQSVCYRALRDLEKLGYVKKLEKNRYTLINPKIIIGNLNKIIDEFEIYIDLRNTLHNSLEKRGGLRTPLNLGINKEKNKTKEGS